MKIDLMGNYVPNDAEIEATMQLEINDAYAPAKREKILRTGVGKDTLDAYFVDKGVEKAAVVADRDLLSATIAYEQAEVRLAQYELSVGKPEQILTTDIQQTDADGLPMFDANGNPVMVTETIPAIDPLPATVDSVDEAGNPIQVPNPEIVRDDAERADAQAVVDGTSVAAIALATQRKG